MATFTIIQSLLETSSEVMATVSEQEGIGIFDMCQVFQNFSGLLAYIRKCSRTHVDQVLCAGSLWERYTWGGGASPTSFFFHFSAVSEN